MVKYPYLVNVFYLLVIWLVLVVRIPKIFWKGIIINSTIMATFGLVIQYHVFYYDWAYVGGLLGTRVGVEDFIFVFSFYALTMTLNHKYLKRFIGLEAKNAWHKKHFQNYIFLLYISLVSFCYYILDIHSFTSTMLPIIPCVLITYYFYPVVLVDTLTVGGWLLLIGIGYFLLTYWVYPNYLEEFWHLDQLPIEFVYMGVPLMDIIWFFAMGLFSRMLLSVWMVFWAKPASKIGKAFL